MPPRDTGDTNHIHQPPTPALLRLPFHQTGGTRIESGLKIDLEWHAFRSDGSAPLSFAYHLHPVRVCQPPFPPCVCVMVCRVKAANKTMATSEWVSEWEKRKKEGKKLAVNWFTCEVWRCIKPSPTPTLGVCVARHFVRRGWRRWPAKRWGNMTLKTETKGEGGGGGVYCCCY